MGRACELAARVCFRRERADRPGQAGGARIGSTSPVAKMGATPSLGPKKGKPTHETEALGDRPRFAESDPHARDPGRSRNSSARLGLAELRLCGRERLLPAKPSRAWWSSDRNRSTAPVANIEPAAYRGPELTLEVAKLERRIAGLKIVQVETCDWIDHATRQNRPCGLSCPIKTFVPTAKLRVSLQKCDPNSAR